MALALSCRLWTQIQNLMQRPAYKAKLAKEREEEQVILEFVEEMCDLQHRLGGIYLIENPAGAASWRQRPLERLLRRSHTRQATSHLCMFGVKNPTTKEPLKKTVRFVSNSQELMKEITRRCSGRHVHGNMFRMTTKQKEATGFYTRALAQAIIRGVEKHYWKRQAEEQEAFPAEDVDMDAEAQLPEDQLHEEPDLDGEEPVEAGQQ